MRLLATIGIAAALLLVLAPGASAHAAEVDVSTESSSSPSTASFAEIGCIPTCEIVATQAGNAPPITVVESGSTVVWSAILGGHTATSDYPSEDKQTLVLDGRAPFRQDLCMDVGINSEEPGRALVALRQGQLAVLPDSQFDAADPEWSVCEEAVELGGGAFALSYHCNVHPRSQNSVLVVTPPA